MRQETAENILLKLNAKSSSYRPAVDGERTLLPPEDVAGALGLGHAEHVEIWIARYIVCHDDSQRTAIHQWLTARAIRDSDRWPEDVPYETKARLAEIALEIALPTNLCTVCRGRKEVPDERGIPEVCPECDGRGYKRQTAQSIARTLGVSRWQYYRYWFRRLHDLVDAFEARRKSLIRKVRKQLT